MKEHQHGLFFTPTIADTPPRKHPTHRMHDNSLDSFAQHDLTGRALEVFNVIRQRGPMTDRQAMAALGRVDPNYVRPAITRLIDDGVLRECGTRKDETTGRNVRVVEINDAN